MANRNGPSRGMSSIDESLNTIALRLVTAAENLDSRDDAPQSAHTQKLLVVFLHYLTMRRRPLTIENISAIVDDPPTALYADLTAALSSIPRGSHAAALTSLRSKVRIVALSNEVSAKMQRAESR